MKLSAARQRGVSLLFSLMALIVLGFAAVALTRSVDTAALIAGNMSFRQDALVASSSGAEEAIAWLTANAGSATLDADNPANGYYASARDNLDLTGNRSTASNQLPIIDWNGDNCNGLSGTYTTCTLSKAGSALVNGNQVRYVITRLCDSVGVPGGTNTCLRPVLASGSANARDRGELVPGGRISGSVASPYYRVVVRIKGARNTVTYTETLVHF